MTTMGKTSQPVYWFKKPKTPIQTIEAEIQICKIIIFEYQETSKQRDMSEFLDTYNMAKSLLPEHEKALSVLKNTEQLYPVSIVKKAFNTFHFVPFPHNNPTWDDWSKENLCSTESL